MSTHNIGFYEDLTKIIFELSSNMHLISSADKDNAMTNSTRNQANVKTDKCILVHSTGTKRPQGFFINSDALTDQWLLYD